MVNVCGSDIPNLSKIVEDAFDSISIYGNDIEFDEVDTDIDVSMNDDLGDYTIDASAE